MNTKYDEYSRSLLWIILAIGFMVRILGVMYGFPQQLDPDERYFVNAAGRMLSDKSLDPGWYGAPASTLIILLAIAYAAIAAFGLVFGIFDSLNDFESLWFDDVTVFYLSGRIITVITGILCIIATYRLAKFFVTKPFALTSAAIVALSPLMVSYSSIIRMDMFQILFMLLVAIYSIKIVEAPGIFKRNFAMSGLFLGLAVTSKYPGVVAVIAILTAAALSSELSVKEKMIGLLIAAFFSLVSAFVSGPYLFLNFDVMLSDVIREARSSHLSASTPGFLMGCLKYLTASLSSSTSVVIALLGYVGLFMMFYRKSKALIVSFLFLAYLVFISNLQLWWTRWSLPLIPLVAVGFSIALQEMYSKIRDQYSLNGWKGISALAVVVVIMLPMLASSTNMSLNKLENNDVRVESLDWVYKNIPKKSKVLLETYAPQLSTHDYEVFIAQSGKLTLWTDYQRHSRPNGYFGNFGKALNELDDKQLESVLAESGVQYIIMSNFQDRFRQEEMSHQAELKIYESMINLSEKVRVFDPDNEQLGFSVRVYKVKN